MGTPLSLVAQTRADSKGCFFVPVQGIGNTEITCLIQDLDDLDSNKTEKIKIKAGDRIKVEF